MEDQVLINVLVTGGSGFIGSNLVKFLISKKITVTVIDNNFRGSLKNLKSVSNKLKFIKGDLRDEKVLKKSLKNIDTVFHLAAINGTENFYKFYRMHNHHFFVWAAMFDGQYSIAMEYANKACEELKLESVQFMLGGKVSWGYL